MEDNKATAGLHIPRRKFLNAWPFFAALFIFYLLLAANLSVSLEKNNGLLIYAQDDPYIHMAMAKNLVRHGVWGVTRYGFTSTSSSILWTALLGAIYFISGVHECTPFILNIIAASGIIFISWVNLKKYLAPAETFAALAALVFFTPLPAVVFTGMEHSLHILLTIAFLFAATDALESPEGPGFKWALILAPFLAAARYEGLFLAFPVCCIFAIKKQFKKALLLGVSSLSLVTAYGLYSIHKGWFFLPNSLLLKGGNSLEYLGTDNFQKATYVTSLLVLSFILFLFLFEKAASKEKNLIVLFIATAIFHMLLANISRFYRYEAYIVAMGVLAVSLSLKKAVSIYNNKAVFVVVLILALAASPPLFKRGFNAFKMTPRATNNIYSQQYQIGLFIRKFFQGRAVATNDIGAINYLADIKNVDLWGLGTVEVASAKLKYIYEDSFIGNLCSRNGVDLAVVYDSWYWTLPAGWERVGQWKIQDNQVCGDDVVSFYSVKPSVKNNLTNDLRIFSATLPRGVDYQPGNHKL